VPLAVTHPAHELQYVLEDAGISMVRQVMLVLIKRQHRIPGLGLRDGWTAMACIPVKHCTSPMLG